MCYNVSICNTHKGDFMASEQFSLRLSKDTKSRLEKLAQATGRTKAFLANDAIEKYLEMEAWQISAIQDGLKDVDNNNLIEYDVIKRKWEIE